MRGEFLLAAMRGEFLLAAMSLLLLQYSSESLLTMVYLSPWAVQQMIAETICTSWQYLRTPII